jgi:hypothetical protein
LRSAEASGVVQSLLEVSPGAAVADQQLKDNYRRLQKRYHPVQTQPVSTQLLRAPPRKQSQGVSKIES